MQKKTEKHITGDPIGLACYLYYSSYFLLSVNLPLWLLYKFHNQSLIFGPRLKTKGTYKINVVRPSVRLYVRNGFSQ